LLDHDRFGMYLMRNYGGKRMMDSVTRQSPIEIERLETIFDFVAENCQMERRILHAGGSGFQ